MATFDVSKVDFDPRKHYSSVRMQQGRVLLDHDFNQNEQIEDEEKRRTQIDIIGAYGTPDNGFSIHNCSHDDGVIDFEIQNGTIYLGGLRMEMDAVNPVETFRTQKDWLQKDDNLDLVPAAGQERFDLVYLEAWQQPVCATEDSSLLEPALGGPDTTTRVKNMRVVKLLKNTNSGDCAISWEALKNKFITDKLGTINDEFERIPAVNLKVSFTNEGTTGDLCFPRETGGYLGAENQAIRVQLAGKNSSDEQLLTWGFDNASPIYRVKIDTEKVTIDSDIKDHYHWPLKGQVIEILPASAILPNGEKISGQSGALRKVTLSYDPDTRQFSMDQPLTASDILKPESGLFMRVWNRGSDLDSPAAIPFAPGTPLQLGNTGLLVTITNVQAIPDLVKEDFWVITARPQSPSRIIPWEFTTTGLSPMGVRRFFAPLAVIRWYTQGGTVVGEVVSDCRIPFNPLTERHETCIVAVPGPGWERIFDRFRDGQDICVCFKNGIYPLDTSVVLSRRGNIKFTGCGEGSKIVVNSTEAAFTFNECRNIIIRDLLVYSKGIGHQGDFKTTKRINGGLSVYNCMDVLVDNVIVICADNREYRWHETACLSIKSDIRIDNNMQGNPAEDNSIPELTAILRGGLNEKYRSAISIKNSEFIVGDKQTGILIVNPGKADLECNRIRSTGKGRGLQGIVIGGEIADNISIRNNLIEEVVQGIHVGTSALGPKDWLMAGTVIISSNKISCKIQADERRQRHGIFAGNCKSLVVQENYIELNIKAVGDQHIVPINGIRIYGKFGKRLMVKDNHLEGFDYLIGKKMNHGIFIKYLTTPHNPRWWIAESNITGSLRIEGRLRLFRTAKMIYADRWRYF